MRYLPCSHLSTRVGNSHDATQDGQSEMSLSTHPIWHLKSLGMHRILSKNCSLCSAKQAKRLNKLYRAMALRDQIEARTNAVNMSSFKTVRERQAQTARDCSAASHVFNEKRKGWLLLVTAWWLKSQNGQKQLKCRTLCFVTHTQLHVFKQRQLRQESKSKAWGKSALKRCYSSSTFRNVSIVILL